MSALGRENQWEDAPLEESGAEGERNPYGQGDGYPDEHVAGDGGPEAVQEPEDLREGAEDGGIHADAAQVPVDAPPHDFEGGEASSMEPADRDDTNTREQRAETIGRFESPAHVDGHCVTLVSPDSYEAGQYLRLRYAVEANRKEDQGLVVGIFSPAAGDGKSLTAMNLSGALAQRKGNRVLLVDADLRRKSDMVRNLVPVPGSNGPGLSELLTDPDQNNIETVARRIEHTNVWLILTGASPLIPYEAFSSPQFERFIEQARDQFDYVIIDAPPVLAVPDCKVIVGSLDGIIMVISANKTPRLMLAQALDNLGPEKVLGLLLNRCDQLPYRYYRYYGNYGYASKARMRDIEKIAGSREGANGGAGENSPSDSPVQF